MMGPPAGAKWGFKRVTISLIHVPMASMYTEGWGGAVHVVCVRERKEVVGGTAGYNPFA
jgi:hypothetical protein